MSDFIEQYELPNKLIAESLIELFRWADVSYHTKPGVVGSQEKESPEIKKSTDLFIDNIQGRTDLTKYKLPQYMEHLDKCVWEYVNKYKIVDYCGRLELRQQPQMQWYKPNEGFKQWHIDGGEDLCDRALVYLTYLNDVKDGGTEFLHHGYVEAECGKTIIFPASLTHIHRGRVAQEDKYIITGWIYWNVS